MNNSFFKYILAFVIIFTAIIKAQSLVDVAVRGVSDNKKDGEQKDRQEATMDAKRQALEKAGLKLKSTTKVENFQTTYDYIETKAETVLMPGFQIIDNGYGSDGTYSVVLVGKVKSSVEEDITFKELRYAKHLLEQNKKDQAKDIITKLMYDSNTDLAEQAHYLYLKWFLTPNDDDVDYIYIDKYQEYLTEFDKFKIYYESSKYIGHLEEKSYKMKAIYENLIKIKLVEVTGGEFQMGIPFLFGRDDEDLGSYNLPGHYVTLDDFYIGQTEITQVQWERVMKYNPSQNKGANNPVESISWNEAVAFCDALSELEGLEKCYGETGCNFNANGYRLPTEAEWEYAANDEWCIIDKNALALTSNQLPYYKYSGSETIDEVAWYKGNSDNGTKPVGLKEPNEKNIYDMSGNVWEFCWDWYNLTYYKKSPSKNPRGPDEGLNVVIRGGSFADDAIDCHTKGRNAVEPDLLYSAVGFRVVRSKE